MMGLNFGWGKKAATQSSTRASVTSWISILTLGLGLVATLAGCAQQNFNAAANNGGDTTSGTPNPTPTPNSCTTTNVGNIYRETKIIFLTDISGSNSYPTANYGSTANCGNGGACTPPTDPNKTFRAGELQNFLNTYSYKTNFAWSFSTFAQNTATPYIFLNGSTSTPGFSSDPNQFQTALNTFLTIPDYGNTPYGAALKLATSAISNDPDRNTVDPTSGDKPQYFVILLTDGFPTDYYDSNVNFQAATMNSELQNLLAAAPGQVNLSTIYYSTQQDQSAISLLQQMASTGGGQFANVNGTTGSFQIQDVIPGSTTGCN